MPENEAKWYVVHTYSGYENKVKYMHDDEVWCECVYVDCHDYQEEADKNGWVNGRFDERKAMLTKVPKDGFYRYKTSPQMLGKWIITGSIRVQRSLSDEEVERLGVETKSVEVNYEVGDSVRITDSPFEDSIGIVDNIDLQNNSVRVIIHMFGRETPVELELSQVEPLE